MKVILAFLEARITVIDAVVKSDEAMDYLSIICSSAAPPSVFSRIIRFAAPRAIIEELDRRKSEEYLAAGAVRERGWNLSHYARSAQAVNDSKRILLGLLLEYRALLSDFNAVLPGMDNAAASEKLSGNFCIPFLVFEKEGELCGLPDFHVREISDGANGSKIIHLKQTFGSRVIVSEELVCIKEIDVPLSVFRGRKAKGHYLLSAPVKGGRFEFTLVIPGFL